MSLRQHFLLDADVTFLNHGSFGATPRPVLDAYQAWQRQIERQPLEFLARQLFDYLAEARGRLGEYVGAPPDDLAFIPNTTFGVNIVARSMELAADDEILTTDHEYGACDNTWTFVSQKTGATIVRQPIALPAETQLPSESGSDMVEQLWQGVTPRTKAIFISHITSQTALEFPVAAICRRARDAGILTIVDGAHAPGQISVDLDTIGAEAIQADFYIGNCHKWMMAPKGSAFIHTRPEHQDLIEPLIVSWGWGEDSPFETGSRYLDKLQWWGTSDPSTFLAVPAAIDFMREHDWSSVRRDCHALLKQALARIGELTGLANPYGEHDGVDVGPPATTDVMATRMAAQMARQMAIASLPRIDDLPAFQERLRADYRIEIPCWEWNDRQFIRVAVQGYNTQADIDRLLEALEVLLPQAA